MSKVNGNNVARVSGDPPDASILLLCSLWQRLEVIKYRL